MGSRFPFSWSIIIRISTLNDEYIIWWNFHFNLNLRKQASFNWLRICGFRIEFDDVSNMFLSTPWQIRTASLFAVPQTCREKSKLPLQSIFTWKMSSNADFHLYIWYDGSWKYLLLLLPSYLIRSRSIKRVNSIQNGSGKWELGVFSWSVICISCKDRLQRFFISRNRWIYFLALQIVSFDIKMKMNIQ